MTSINDFLIHPKSGLIATHPPFLVATMTWLNMMVGGAVIAKQTVMVKIAIIVKGCKKE
jgi:hypothetical protein